MISARFGGIVYSRTQAILDYYGVSEATGNARDLGYVQINGADRVNPEQWYGLVAGGETVPQYYTYSATNVRLQEATVASAGNYFQGIDNFMTPALRNFGFNVNFNF